MNKVETSIREPSRTQSPTVKVCWLDNWFMIIQVHPAIIFYKMSVRRSKIILPIIFYHLRTAKIFLMTVLFMYKFRSLSNKFSTISWSLILHISLPRLGYFCRKKEGLLRGTFHLKAVSIQYDGTLFSLRDPFVNFQGGKPFENHRPRN